MIRTITHTAGKIMMRAIRYGFVSLVLYFLLYFFEDYILHFTSQGGWYFIAPIVIAFVFSYFHGTFTSHFWDSLGIKAKK